MKILNFGSLNIDHVYAVDHFVRPGETLASLSYRRGSGGKGNNQSIALARAGAPVWHAGKIGEGGAWLLALLRQAGANTSLVARGPAPTGHAIIQVQPDGENCIGYFLADYARSGKVERALRVACQAAAICVTRPGAADSIPRLTPAP